MHHFLILGGDPRQLCLSHILEQKGHDVNLYYENSSLPFSLKQAAEVSDIIICPVPFSKDNNSIFSVNQLDHLEIGTLLTCLKKDHVLFGGNIPARVKLHCQTSHISCFDFMKMESVAWKNAIATAEGAVAEAISLSPGNLHKSRCLVTGWGRCAQTLAGKLKGMDARVTISCRNSDKLAQAFSLGYEAVSLEELGSDLSGFEFIFNTAPAPVITSRMIESMNRDAAVIDLASAPGGVDFHACETAGIPAKLCPGLPGKYSPKASAWILYEAVMAHIKEADVAPVCV